MAQLIEIGGGPVNETERRIVELLLGGLPSYFWVAPNVTLTEKPSGRSLEYDAVVLAGHAVYVVEVKGWRGTIRAINRHDWQLASGHYTANPLPLIDVKAKVLKSLLSDLELVAPGGFELKTPYVMGCLVCGSDNALLEVFPEERQRCLRPSELCAFIQDRYHLPFHAERDQYKPVLPQLAAFLEGRLRGRDPAPRRFASFRVTETVAQREESAEYLATHAEFDDGRVYRVRTWWVSPYRFEPAERERRLKVLRRSAEALHLIGSHPNVVSLHAFDVEADCVFEVTEWGTAGTLATALSLGSPRKWSVERRLALLLGIARALAAAHEKDIFHRDLRPSAILLGPDGQPKVGDFDLAFMMSADETVFGEAALKPIADHRYRPPELRDAATADVFDSTDLYSLGRIAFDVFAGQQPGAPPGQELPLLSTLCEPGEIPDQIVEDLDLLVSSMVQLDPHARPESPAAVVEMLEEILERGRRTPPPSPLPETERGSRKDGAEGVPPFPRREGGTGGLGPGARIDSSNEVIEVLGRGASSTVYLVRNDVLQDELALKLVQGEGDREGPARELKLLMKLAHPNLVKAFWAGALPGAGDDPGPTYLLMERLRGDTLAARLEEAQGGRLPVDEALSIVRDLAGALDALHTASPPHVHRDLKLENIYLTDRGPVLGDLGSAVPLAEAGTAPVGSLRYTPPDLAEAGWGPDADLFALGTVAWQMLSGRPPWGSAAPSTEAPPDSLDVPDLAPEIAEVIVKAASPLKKDRFDSAADLLEALDRAAAGPEPEPVAEEPAKPPKRPASPWNVTLVKALSERTSPTQVLYSVLREGSKSSVLQDARDVSLGLQAQATAAEARLMALEAPLAEAFLSLYDELATPCGAWPVLDLAELSRDEDDETEPATFELGGDDVLLVLDGLMLVEVPRLIEAAHELGHELVVDEWVWRAGPTDPALPEEGAGALSHLFGAPPELYECPDGAALARELEAGQRRLRMRLEAGRRDDDLSAVLAQRRSVIESVLLEVAAALGDAPLWVTSTFGAVYLGHGMRIDVGSGASHRADAIRAAWRAACPDGRVGRVSAEVVKLEGPVFRPSRQMEDRVFPVGRLAWPDSPDAPRLPSGGLSLPERLLPLVRFRRS